MIRFCKLSEEMKKTQQANTAIMKCLECSCGYGYLWVRMFLILSILRDSIRRPEGCLRSFSLPIKILHPKSVIHVPTRETISVLYLLRNVSDSWPDLHNEIIKMSAFIWQNRITKNEKNAIDKFTKAWQTKHVEQKYKNSLQEEKTNSQTSLTYHRTQVMIRRALGGMATRPLPIYHHTRVPM